MKMKYRFETINITMWDDLAVNEGNVLESQAHEKLIVAITGLKKKIYQGIIQIISTKTPTYIV